MLFEWVYLLEDSAGFIRYELRATVRRRVITLHSFFHGFSPGLTRNPRQTYIQQSQEVWLLFQCWCFLQNGESWTLDLPGSSSLTLI